MTEVEGRAAKGFHELPLVLFTTLAIAGTGLIGARLVFSVFSWLPWLPPRSMTVASLACLALGLGVSTFHLGRPLRGYRAVVRVAQSPLSNEILTLVAAMILILATAWMPEEHGLTVPVAAGAMVSSVLALLALGRVYRLPSQLTWSGLVVLQPLVLGMGLGLALHLEALGGGARARGELIVLLVFLADGLLLWERTGRLATGLARGIPVHPRLMRRRGPGFGLRVLFGVLLPSAALLGGSPRLAGATLAVNLILDRVLFYGLAVVSSTEAEVLRVEAALKGGLRPAHEPPSSPLVPPSAHEG